MRIVTPDDASDPGLPPVTRQSLAISNLSRVQANPARGNIPASDIFGPEPEHGWCFYFQKADLARQVGDWERVAALGDEAQAHDFNMTNTQSNTPQEWIPFIEGYAHVGRWKDAQEISQLVLAANPKMDARVCDAWKALQKIIPEVKQQQEVQNMLSGVKCTLQ
jgi:hypothetical protein